MRSVVMRFRRFRIIRLMINLIITRSSIVILRVILIRCRVMLRMFRISIMCMCLRMCLCFLLLLL